MSRKSITLLATALASGSLALASPAQAGTDAYIGDVSLFGFNFCPVNTAPADGALLSIAQNTALFALLGTTYGGNGQTTFALPDLRGRLALMQGQGPGLSNYVLGQVGGTESTTLTLGQLPTHSHTGLVRAENTVLADTGNPQGNALARAGSNIYSNNSPPSATAALHPGTLQVNPTGGSQPFSQMQPFLVMNFCVVTQGIFPSRN